MDLVFKPAPSASCACSSELVHRTVPVSTAVLLFPSLLLSNEMFLYQLPFCSSIPSLLSSIELLQCLLASCSSRLSCRPLNCSSVSWRPALPVSPVICRTVPVSPAVLLSSRCVPARLLDRPPALQVVIFASSFIHCELLLLLLVPCFSLRCLKFYFLCFYCSLFIVFKLFESCQSVFLLYD